MLPKPMSDDESIFWQFAWAAYRDLGGENWLKHLQDKLSESDGKNFATAVASASNAHTPRSAHLKVCETRREKSSKECARQHQLADTHSRRGAICLITFSGVLRIYLPGFVRAADIHY
jgi:hypothetical protein